MSVSAPTTSTSGTELSTPGNSITSSNSDLGEGDFLQLMMDQLENQNPLSPADPTQYVSELASFSSLEQETNIASTTQTASDQSASTEALALVGHSVTYTDDSGTNQTGTVSSVQFTSSGPTLTIGAESGIALSNVTEAS